jgi:Uma2 family endonuclease
MTAIPLEREVFYPESDGKPVAETEVHFDEITDLARALKERYRDDRDVYVGANMLFYYREGLPKHSVAPDVFVVHGVEKKKRRIYKLWEEGKAPSAVFEITSASTKNEDLRTKKALYEELGVEEYFLHDPLGEYLSPTLQGFRLIAGRYQRIIPQADGSVASRTLGLILKEDKGGLRLIDAATGEPLLRIEETQERARQAIAAEAEVARLRAELARLKQST